MADILISRTVPQPITLECLQPGELAPIDCSTFTAAIEQTTLPWTPLVIAIDAAQGRWQIAAPNSLQAASLAAGKRYGLHIVWRNAAGTGVLEADLTLVVK